MRVSGLIITKKTCLPFIMPPRSAREEGLASRETGAPLPCPPGGRWGSSRESKRPPRAPGPLPLLTEPHAPYRDEHMRDAMTSWIDGEFVDSSRATVPLLSHSFSRGSAIFEVMAITSAAQGPAFFCLEEHLDRFFFSAEQTCMKIPFDKDGIRGALQELARRNGVRDGVAKFYAYYPDIELGTTPSERLSVAVFCIDYEKHGVKRGRPSEGVSVGISQYRKLHPQTTCVHAKVAGNYVNGYLARMEVKRRGFDEALMLDTCGTVAEAPTANIFLIRGTSVETPTIENVLPGITRRVIMRILDDMGFPEKEVRIRPEDLPDYEEAFFSGTTVPVQPISQIESTVFTCPGPMTSEIRSRMAEIMAGRDPHYADLLTYIPQP
jgi:branched-chain amino acid aminotransferase